MKKRIVGIFLTAGFLLLVSCGSKNGVIPVEPTGGKTTPTPIVVPTCTPTVGLPADPVLKPTATATPTNTNTPSPEPTWLPSATPTPELTTAPLETLIPSFAPTQAPLETLPPAPSVSPTAKPTTALQETPVPSPTVCPTACPTLSPTPSPTPSPAPTATPVPEVDPEALVTNGWQKSIVIDEAYAIIFPETFQRSVVSRTDSELTIGYYSDKEPEIVFNVCYKIQKTVKEVALDIVAANGMIIDEVPEEKRVDYLWKQDGTVYRGVLIERRYSQALLGNSFGEEEWITGVMQVEFAYPAELSGQYETEEYKYYVIENREE